MTENKEKLEEEKKPKSWLREWLDAALFAIIAALIIRTFFFEAYRIPTPSMENTLMTGDFVAVSKMSYGARTPMSLGIPFTEIFLPGVQLPWTRLPGFDEVDRNDIVVFNYPIDNKPIAEKANYVKRCVGIPGDTLELIDKRLFVNGSPAYRPEGLVEKYRVLFKSNVRISRERLENLGGKLPMRSSDANELSIMLTVAQASEMMSWQEVDTLMLDVMPKDAKLFRGRFNFSKASNNTDHFNQFVVPFKGQIVELNLDNYPIYKDVIERYEGNTVRIAGSSIFINNEQSSTYEIKKDYYFMMGDYRDNSEDSRFWGFVPDDHIVGSPLVVYYSSENYVPRFERIMKWVGNPELN